MNATMGVQEFSSLKEEQAFKEEARLQSKNDLFYLAKYVLGYDKLVAPLHQVMAKDIDTPKHKFSLLLWPRGHFKSTIGTEARSIQLLLRDPNERILITNAKLDNARKFLRVIASHFENNARFRWIWRDYWIQKYATAAIKAARGDNLDWVERSVGDELTLVRPELRREASISTGAVDSSLVSQHYSTIIVDDIINREYVSTPGMVDKSILYFKDLVDLLDSSGRLEIIGTRWAYHDFYNWIIETFGGKASLRVPDGYIKKEIVQESKKTLEKDKNWLISIKPARNEQGDPIFPEVFPDKVLKELLKAKGAYEYGAQYELNPIPVGDQKFLEEWFNKENTIPDIRELSVCITVDPAKSIKETADYSTIVVCGYDSFNNMYLLDGLMERLTIDELPEAVFEYVLKYRDSCKMFYPLGFESIGFQEIYVFQMERMMRERNCYFAIEGIAHRNVSKADRILRLVPRIKNGFYVPATMMKQPFSKRNESAPYDLVQELITQMMQFPYGKHDDLADALATQLDIVGSLSLPSKHRKEKKLKKGWVHRSELEDKRRQRPMVLANFGVVRSE